MLDLFNSADFIIFTTRDYANYSSITVPAASKRLLRLADKKLLTRVTKGLWANTGHPWFHPLACVPYLLGKEQGYVSFLSALHLHGLVSQIPKTMQIATTGHARTRFSSFPPRFSHDSCFVMSELVWPSALHRKLDHE